uniref:Uncharacterized protein n=1 Tax=viral metagenome TaxID=1070528 RepID=A0A6M3L787_9ZZZZ
MLEGNIRIMVYDESTNKTFPANEHNCFFDNGFLRGIQNFMKIEYSITLSDPPTAKAAETPATEKSGTGG